MGIFEEMGFCGKLEFFSAPHGEGEVVPEHEQETAVEEDYSDEEMDVDELERRMWRDRMLLKKLKEQSKSKECVDSQSREQAWRKKMSDKKLEQARRKKMSDKKLRMTSRVVKPNSKYMKYAWARH